MMDAHELKQIQVQINKAKAAEAAALESLNNQKQIYETQKNHRISLENKLKQISIEPRVSEHALIRYVQRVYGIDMEKIESEILTEANKKAARSVINGKIPLGNGFRAVVKNMTIVSIVDN